MAAKEVIHFPFGVQLFARPQFPASVLPEPVAESPPQIDENLRHVQATPDLCARRPQERKNLEN